MNRAFMLKVLGIFLLTVLMSWAVSYINSLILERQQRQIEVKQEIAKSSAGEQTVTGPILVVPYVEEYSEITTENNIKKTETKRDNGYTIILPENLTLNGGFTNEYKRLGIYKALMYQMAGSVKGTFNIPANFNIAPSHNNGSIHTLPAYISLGISDPRGIITKPIFNWNNQAMQFSQGSNLKALGTGIHVELPHLNVANLSGAAAQNIPFEFNLNLRGMENFNFIPIADNNIIALKSSWKHPHFNGSFLPDSASEKIDANGFSAKWEVSSLSSNNQAALINKLEHAETNNILESLSVGFVEPINVYSQANRATKYGLLFIGLTFAGFFIFEILKRLRIHPAQYTFVGLAMALFYLLLISLSERIGFAVSYLAASLACISLLGYYLTYVLKSKTNGILFAGLLTALYGALYGILASEDNALLMGSLLVFGLLALTMIVTRKVDWYQISNKPEIHNNETLDNGSQAY